MQHLSGETLARLVDDEPTAEEALHLATCPPCDAELEEMRLQTSHLAALPDLVPREDSWPRVHARMSADPLLGSQAGLLTGGLILRIAAALALFLGGTVTGAIAFRGIPDLDTAATRDVAPPADPRVGLREAEAAYVAALARYSEATGAGEAVDPLNRLAALEGIVLTTRAALEEEPADPIINGYHLSAVGQRDAILRRIDAEAEEEPWY